MQQRPVMYYVATTLDHYIAHEDGSVEGFLPDGPHVQDYVRDLQRFDTVLMGRNTYEFGYQYGVEPGHAVPMYGHMQQYVFSKTVPASKSEQLHVVRDDPAKTVSTLKQQEGTPIYLSGGGALAGYLLNLHLIDEVILKINPVLFGAGIPLFSGVQTLYELTPISTKVYPNGVIFAHYAVGA